MEKNKSFNLLHAEPGIRSLLQSKIFWIVILLKLILGSLLSSYYLRDLFIPFVNYFVESSFRDPWSHFAELGRWNSFPYPPFMLYVLAIPRWFFGWFLSSGTDTVTIAHLFVMRLPLLFSDIFIAFILAHWFPQRISRILLLYWCSPIVIYISYWHGQLDVIPTFIFLLCLFLLRKKYYIISMVVFGIGLGTKSHLLLALPLLFIYIAKDQNLRSALWACATSFIVYFLVVLPYLPDPAYRRMVYETAEQARFYAFQLWIGGSNLAILLAPGAVFILTLRFLSYTKHNWDLLMLYLGIFFCICVLLAPPRPGYFIWFLPFLVHFFCRRGNFNPTTYFVFVFSYLAFFLLGQEGDLFDTFAISLPQVASWQTPYQLLTALNPSSAVFLNNTIFTLLECSLASLIVGIYMYGVRSNSVYRLRTTPILLGVAGDSGSGKTTFVRLIGEMLGKERVTIISGDDYHRWPRGHESWQVFTHLDVEANEVYKQYEHAIALFDGKSIFKGSYDHATGQFTEKRILDPREFVIFEGLHSLFIGGQRHLYDLKIFIDPDEPLRQFWKVRRDIQHRGHTLSQVLKTLEIRKKDRDKFVLPQLEKADLVLRWLPKDPIDMNQLTVEPELELEFLASNSFNFSRLMTGLRQLTTVSVIFDPSVDSRWQSLRLSGTVQGEKLKALAIDLVPNLEELIERPVFSKDLPGLIQLSFLFCISEKLRWSHIRMGGFFLNDND